MTKVNTDLTAWATRGVDGAQKMKATVSKRNLGTVFLSVEIRCALLIPTESSTSLRPEVVTGHVLPSPSGNSSLSLDVAVRTCEKC